MVSAGAAPQEHDGRGRWLVLAGAVLWGTTGTAQALGPEGVSPYVLGAARMAIGGAGLLAYALARGSLRGRTAWPKLETVLAAGSMAAYQLFFFAALLRTGVAIGTVVAIGSAPMFAGGLGLLYSREKLTLRWAVATLVAVAGCTLLLLTGHEVQVDLFGILLALGAGLSYAVYAVSSKRLLEAHPPEAVTAVVFGLGALLLLPWLWSADLTWLLQPRGLLVALHLGLLATALAYVLFSWGLKQVPVAAAVTLSLAEPLTAGSLGVLLLGERLTAGTSIGIGLVLAGLVIISLERPGARRRKPNEQV